MIELTETTYIIAIWFIQWEDRNWMCCAYREKPNADWTIRYRFRYFNDDRVFDSDDRRSWFGVKVRSNVSESTVEAKMDAFAMLIASAGDAELERIVVHGSVWDLKEKAKGSAFFHSAFVGDEQAFVRPRGRA